MTLRQPITDSRFVAVFEYFNMVKKGISSASIRVTHCGEGYLIGLSYLLVALNAYLIYLVCRCEVPPKIAPVATSLLILTLTNCSPMCGCFS